TISKFFANFLLSNIPIGDGVINEKRVKVFSGKLAVEALCSPLYLQKCKKGVPITNEKKALEVLSNLLEEGFYVKCKRSGNTRYFEPDVSREFTKEGFYTWVYEGSQWMTILGGVLLLLLAMTFVMFPLWPYTVRNGVWYLGMLAVGFIVFIMFLGVVRLILFVITFFALPPGIWLFPNLFEDVGFFESFVPLYEWHNSSVENVKSKRE
ncbi:translocation protein Sec62, partial [Rozella allomycis CSF55]